MPDEQPQDNRATVAQTLAEVRGTAAEIRGLRDLVDARFTETQRQLDGVVGLPALVAGMQAQIVALDLREKQADGALDRRVTALEDDDVRSRDWRRGSLPLILLAGVSAFSAIAAVAASLVPH